MSETEVSGMGHYVGLIQKDTDSDFGVSFPDLPGVIIAGLTFDDALDMAEEALALHLEGLAKDGDASPEPSSLEQIMSDPDNRSKVAILVSVKDDQPKVIRGHVT